MQVLHWQELVATCSRHSAKAQGERCQVLPEVISFGTCKNIEGIKSSRCQEREIKTCCGLSVLFFLSFPQMKSLLKVFACSKCILALKQAFSLPQGLKRCYKDTCLDWMSAVLSHKHRWLEQEEWKKVSESREGNWDEMPGWFGGTKRLGWKGWKNPRSFHPSEPREQRRQNWYLLACCNLSFSLCLEVCMCVEHSTQLNSLHASTKIPLVYDFIKQIPITSIF